MTIVSKAGQFFSVQRAIAPDGAPDVVIMLTEPNNETVHARFEEAQFLSELRNVIWPDLPPMLDLSKLQEDDIVRLAEQIEKARAARAPKVELVEQGALTITLPAGATGARILVNGQEVDGTFSVGIPGDRET